MDQLVAKEIERWTNLFEEIEGCQPLETEFEHNRILIASPNPVPWHDGLKPQYREADYKIGYLFSQKRGIRLDIDFPIMTLTKEYIRKMIDPNEKLNYSPSAERAPTTRSYWRFTSGDMFDTLTLVIPKPHLAVIDTTLPTIRQLFKEIVAYANEK